MRAHIHGISAAKACCAHADIGSCAVLFDASTVSLQSGPGGKVSVVLHFRTPEHAQAVADALNHNEAAE